jgi:NAD(P)-dependent dehydrogenase (short-subunit alcohol dehydrogenase family)
MAQHQHHVTVVTGGSRGIGAAVVRELARAGHDLVVGYHSDRDAASRVVVAAQTLGARCISCKVDVRAPDDTERLFSTAEAAFGPATGLVNNAGLTAHIANLADTPIEAIRRVIDVNFLPRRGPLRA